LKAGRKKHEKMHLPPAWNDAHKRLARQDSTIVWLGASSMNFFARRRSEALPRAIAAHRNAHARRVRIDQLSQTIWWPVRIVLRSVSQQRARSALRLLVSINPATAEEAREKALYLMAILIAGGDKLDQLQVQTARVSLARHRDAVSSMLVADQK
jgi:hypothetical protein